MMCLSADRAQCGWGGLPPPPHIFFLWLACQGPEAPAKLKNRNHFFHMQGNIKKFIGQI